MDITPEQYKRLNDLIGQNQAQGIIANYILLEVVIDLARSKPDGNKFLSEMFDRVMRRWEHRETPEEEAHPVSVEAKWTAETFFSQARKRLG